MNRTMRFPRMPNIFRAAIRLSRKKSLSGKFHKIKIFTVCFECFDI